MSPQDQAFPFDFIRIHQGPEVRTKPVCNICGHDKGFTLQDIDPRETYTCLNCGGWNRHRQVAYVLSPNGLLHKGVKGLTIWNMESERAIHNQIKGLPGYHCSEYLGPEHASGDEVNGIVHQDIHQTSYPDGFFDLVISLDVFEHLPFPYKAHEEILRVLKPQGRHVFTVPFFQAQLRDQRRAIADPISKEVTHILEPIYHGDPVTNIGALVYNVFAMEMLVRMEKMGYDVKVHFINIPQYAISGNNALVFERRKRWI